MQEYSEVGETDKSTVENYGWLDISILLKKKKKPEWLSYIQQIGFLSPLLRAWPRHSEGKSLVRGEQILQLGSGGHMSPATVPRGE